MLKAKLDVNISDSPMSIKQALRHKYADQFMQAFSEEISSLKEIVAKIPSSRHFLCIQRPHKSREATANTFISTFVV